MKTKRDMLASALIVLSIAIKPYGALLLPVVLVRRHCCDRCDRRRLPAAPAAAGAAVWLEWRSAFIRAGGLPSPRRRLRIS